MRGLRSLYQLVPLRGRLLRDRAGARRSLLLTLGVQAVAQAVADEVAAEDDGGDGDAGERGEVARAPEVTRALLEQRAPAVVMQAADAEEAEAGLDEDDPGEGEGGLDDQRRQDVGDHVAQHDASRAGADGARGDHELALADLEHLA